MSEQNAVQTKQDTSIVGLITGDWKNKMALALPKHITADRMMRVALTAINKTPKLAQCTRESMFSCLMSCSELGLEPDGRRAHLIPYGDKATLIIDYKGLIELAKRSGMVRVFRSELVCENDKFTYKNGAVDHEINFREPRGNVFAVYSYVKDNEGNEEYEVMNREEVEAIRKRSRAGNAGPWVTDWNEMAKKTVIRRHSKRLVLSPEFATALEKDDDTVIDITGAIENIPVAKKGAEGLVKKLGRPKKEKVADGTATPEPVKEDNLDMGATPDTTFDRAKVLDEITALIDKTTGTKVKKIMDAAGVGAKWDNGDAIDTFSDVELKTVLSFLKA